MSVQNKGRVFDFIPDVAEPEPKRKAAMTREEIDECNDVRFLRDKADEYAETCIVIKTMLDFPDTDDRDWFVRARAALIHFKIAGSRIERRMRSLRTFRPEASHA